MWALFRSVSIIGSNPACFLWSNVRTPALCCLDKEALWPGLMWVRSVRSEEPQHLCPFAPPYAQKRCPRGAFHQQTRAWKPQGTSCLHGKGGLINNSSTLLLYSLFLGFKPFFFAFICVILKKRFLILNFSQKKQMTCDKMFSWILLKCLLLVDLLWWTTEWSVCGAKQQGSAWLGDGRAEWLYWWQSCCGST